MGDRLFVLCFAASMLVACGGEKAGAESSAQVDVALPKPGAVTGSVTGMPNPGIASAPRAVMQAPALIELPDQIEAGQGVAGGADLQLAPDSAPPADTLNPREPEVVMDAPANGPPPDATNVTDPVPLQQ